MLNIRRHVIGIIGRFQVGRGPHIVVVIDVDAAVIISATRVVFAVVISIVLLVVMTMMRAHFKSLAGWRDNQSCLSRDVFNLKLLSTETDYR